LGFKWLSDSPLTCHSTTAVITPHSFPHLVSTQGGQYGTDGPNHRARGRGDLKGPRLSFDFDVCPYLTSVTGLTSVRVIQWSDKLTVDQLNSCECDQRKASWSPPRAMLVVRCGIVASSPSITVHNWHTIIRVKTVWTWLDEPLITEKSNLIKSRKRHGTAQRETSFTSASSIFQNMSRSFQIMDYGRDRFSDDSDPTWSNKPMQLVVGMEFKT
jgi:hypothetical protein